MPHTPGHDELSIDRAPGVDVRTRVGIGHLIRKALGIERLQEDRVREIVADDAAEDDAAIRRSEVSAYHVQTGPIVRRSIYVEL